MAIEKREGERSTNIDGRGANRIMCSNCSSGIPYAEAIKRIWMKDSRGLIVADRPEGGITAHKAPFAHQHKPMKVKFNNVLYRILSLKSYNSAKCLFIGLAGYRS